MPNPNVFSPSEVNAVIPDRPKDWFSYPATFPVAPATTIANGIAQTFTLQIDAASDFYWTAGSFVAYVTGVTDPPTFETQAFPLLTVLITDQGSNKQLMQNPVQLGSIFGPIGFPHRLIHPRKFFKNSAIQVIVTSNDANNTLSYLQLNFEGFRIY